MELDLELIDKGNINKINIKGDINKDFRNNNINITQKDKSRV